MRYAVIDLGTNTFNLLIFEPDSEKTFKKIISTKRSVKLGLGGINSNHLTQDAMLRGERAISSLYAVIEKYEVSKTFTYATSAIRSAANGGDFKKIIESKFPLEITIISGEREAELIYKGVSLAVDFTDQPVLILDIGGGSNEFIIANNTGILWKQSFNIGIARLIEHFHPSDPIKTNEISEIENYLLHELEPMFAAVKENKASTLIGSSGSFETFADILELQNSTNPACEIDLKQYNALHQTLVESTLEQRRKMQGLVLMRTEMIVLASVLTQLVIKKAGITKLIKADYSLKEGMISEILG